MGGRPGRDLVGRRPGGAAPPGPPLTTIAYRDGILAADSLAHEDGLRQGYIVKVGPTPDGGAWGLTGMAGHTALWRAWACGDRSADPPGFAEESDAILIEPDGRVRVWTEEKWEELEDTIYAWGSGTALALGAMEHGATAEEAVACAIRRDMGSHGKICTVKIGALISQDISPN